MFGIDRKSGEKMKKIFQDFLGMVVEKGVGGLGNSRKLKNFKIMNIFYVICLVATFLYLRNIKSTNF